MARGLILWRALTASGFRPVAATSDASSDATADAWTDAAPANTNDLAAPRTADPLVRLDEHKHRARLR